MRHLNLQFQPERAPKVEAARVREIVGALSKDRRVVAGYETSSGDDDGPYINFTFLAKNLPKLWARVKSEVLANSEIGAGLTEASIVVCEGDHGWDDYLLLHHFDRRLKLDDPDEV